MSEERHRWPDVGYWDWHKPENLRKFLGERASRLKCVDIDAVEYCADCGEPIALFEITRSWGEKFGRVTRRVGEKAGLPVYLVRWGRRNAVYEFMVLRWKGSCEAQLTELESEKSFAEFLWRLREIHWEESWSCPESKRRREQATIEDERRVKKEALEKLERQRAWLRMRRANLRGWRLWLHKFWYGDK